MARRYSSATKELKKLVEMFVPSIRNAFLDSIQNIVDTVTIENVIESIKDGDITGAVHALGLEESAFRPVIAEIERAFEVGGVTTANTFPKSVMSAKGRTVFRFDVRNSRAEAALRNHSSEKVREITDKTRATVRKTIEQGMFDGRNPRNIALDLVGRKDAITGKRSGGVIGLTEHQKKIIDNAREELKNLDPAYLKRNLRHLGSDSVVKRAIESGKPLTEDQINKLVEDYRNNYLRYRGEVIARTESIWSLNNSEHEAIKQSVEQGIIKESQVKRVWDSAGNDGRTRETHLLMDGQTVGLNEPFTFPDMVSRAMFPGDTSLGAPEDETIQCRCIARTMIDWLANARDMISAEDRAALLSLSDADLFGGRG